MKKAVILFLVASCLMGCKRSTEYLDDAPEAADNEDLEAEQEERVLREAPLGDEKEIRCDIDFGTYSQELMTRKSRKPAIYRFSKNQIKKNICSGYYQFFYGTDSFDVDCYEIKSGYDSKNNRDAVVMPTGFSARYHIDCPSELKRVDYSYLPSSTIVPKNASTDCKIDALRTSEEFGYAPRSSATYATAPYKPDSHIPDATNWFCKNADLQFHKYVVRCSLTDRADFDDLFYLKIVCPGFDNEQYDEKLRNVPTHANTSLKCDIRLPAPKARKNKPQPKPKLVTSENINLFRTGTSNDDEIEAYFEHKYCSEKNQLINNTNKYDIVCQGRDVDAYNNIVTTDVTKNFQISCPKASHVDFSDDGSGKTSNALCYIDNYYTAREFSWSVHDIRSYSFEDIIFNKSTLNDAVKKKICQEDNDRMLVGTQLNGKEFVVYCHGTEVHDGKLEEEDLYFKSDCKEVPVKQLTFDADEKKPDKPASPSDKSIPEIRSYIGYLTSEINSDPFKAYHHSNQRPDDVFTEAQMKMDYCNPMILKKYGNSFDIHWEETKQINDQPEPVLGGFDTIIHVDCDPDSIDANTPERADIMDAPVRNDVPSAPDLPLMPQKGSEGFRDMADLINKTSIKPIDFTCKLSLPNDRKAITVISDKTMPPLNTAITENWAISSFCSDKLQIEHKSSKFEVSCHQTIEGKPANNVPVKVQFACPPLAVIDYNYAGSGNEGFVSCRTDSTHTLKEFKWELENDFGIALPGDNKFKRKSMTSTVKNFLCKSPQVQHKKVVVRCELNKNPQNKTYEDSMYLKINCN